ncbi:hypothetical protein [Acetonema longum]|uniref:Uncharacterized protein n=1 Tax=Acetonema longum DSM 6540 TaxID=1009370 RepID=F7NEH9_9FIRM|nr:hypothetical protein [Acetonema longum]EGO65390.1 hypothetical protein ALO_02211 [Acetonema longum DSM 6540]
MTREEVLQSLETLGVSIHSDTLRRWVNAELVPFPDRGNKGRAGGRWTEYPPETPWEAFAAAHLLKDHSIKQVAEIREQARWLITETCWGDMEDLNKDFQEWQDKNTVTYEQEGDHGIIEASHKEVPSGAELPEKEIAIDTLIFAWLMIRIKAEYAIPLEVPTQVRIDYFGNWEKDKRPHFVEAAPAGFPNIEDFKGVEYILEWRIAQVTEGSRDEIVMQDKETGVKLTLHPWKDRKMRA